MIYEYAIMPEVFSREYERETIEFLKDIRNDGMIASFNKSEWTKKVYTYIETLSPMVKDRLITLLKMLKDKKAIVYHPKSDLKCKDEGDCLQIALQEHEIIPFFYIISTKKNEFSTTIDNLIVDEKWLNRKRSLYILQTEENFKEAIKPLLIYAQKLRVIDPYFNLREERYQKSFEIITDFFRSRRGKREKGTIEIHIKYDQYAYEHPKYMKMWEIYFKKAFNTYGHICKLYIWKENEQYKMHDRYILTDQFYVQVGNGLDIRTNSKSTWNLIDNNTAAEIVKEYSPNSSRFELFKEFVWQPQ
jgi:hypothetical protein